MGDHHQRLGGIGYQLLELAQHRHRLAHLAQPGRPARGAPLGAAGALGRLLQPPGGVGPGRGQQLGHRRHLAVLVVAEPAGQRLGQGGRLPGLGQHVRHGAGLGDRVPGGLDQAQRIHRRGVLSPGRPRWTAG
ncbi:hypothetical protein C7C46_20090 [Streptomyces tateyamensis]|uniref:Uncharacterized protein n=1 Tax=Streptomyces tateyamensis TaxID=565073 RepID=A0A2V4NMW4_9ACTN|nr:hypothetical protein C7C46_20090 [Streptomyces tateyamensis]